MKVRAYGVEVVRRRRSEIGTGITWEVNGFVGGSSKTGTISTTRLYSAPNSVPTTSSNSKSVTATVTVTAVSQADSTATEPEVVRPA